MIKEGNIRVTLTLPKGEVQALQLNNKYHLSLSKQIEILIKNYNDKKEKEFFENNWFKHYRARYYCACSVREEKKMKIIFKKQASKIATQLTSQLVIMLKAHGIKPKQETIINYERKVRECLEK